MADLARRALAVNQALLALGSEVFQADRATFVRNPSVPNIYDSNHVEHVSASTPEEINRLLAHRGVAAEQAGVMTEVRVVNLDRTAGKAVLLEDEQMLFCGFFVCTQV